MATERNPRQVLMRHMRALEHRQKHLVDRLANPDRREQSKSFDRAESSALSVAIWLLQREIESAHPLDVEKELSNATR